MRMPLETVLSTMRSPVSFINSTTLVFPSACINPASCDVYLVCITPAWQYHLCGRLSHKNLRKWRQVCHVVKSIVVAYLSKWNLIAELSLGQVKINKLFLTKI